jgi:hypothetical protein
MELFASISLIVLVHKLGIGAVAERLAVRLVNVGRGSKL